MRKMNPKFAVGTTHETKSNGILRVIKYNSCKDVDVEFVDTGYTTKTTTGNINKGLVKDRLSPLTFGIGFIGDLKCCINYKTRRSYHVWFDMLSRCYSTEWLKSNKTYIGCSVCDEWKCYSNFASWFDENYIEGFHLDKDIKIKGNKIYSPETCAFVDPALNQEAAHAKNWIAISPSGERFEIYNLNKFCRDNNLGDCSSFRKAISGKKKHHKGWTKGA